MGDEMSDDLVELPAAQPLDISEPALVLLELAVTLHLRIDLSDDAVCVAARDRKYVITESGAGAELLSATRQAVTRAAAEIGR